MPNITVFRHIFVLPVCLLFALAPLHAQTGPGGVGNASSNAVWLDASSLTGVANGGKVDLWSDRSGNNRNAAQTVGDQQPTFISNGVNGKPVLRFDGQDNDFADNMWLPTLTVNNNFTIFSVCKPTTTHETDAETTAGADGVFGQRYLLYPIWGGGNNPDVDAGAGLSVGTNGISAYEHSAGYMPALAVASLPLTGFHTLGFQYQAKRPSLFLDNRLVRTGLTSLRTGNIFTSWRIGGATDVDPNNPGPGRYGDFWGDVAEVIWYDYTLPATQRIIVENYLAAKYGLAIANDFYTTHDPAYHRDVQGIGTLDGTEKHTQAANGAGLQLAEGNNSLNAANEFVFAGHGTAQNGLVADNVPNTFAHRWQRSWYVQKTGSADVRLTFSFSQAGLATPSNLAQAAASYRLLYRSNLTGNFSAVSGVTPVLVTGTGMAFDLTNAQLQNGYYTIGLLDGPVAEIDVFREQMDYVFQNVDKTRIPTGFLEEYGVGLLPFRRYNGTLTDSSKVNITVWRALYATLSSARINGTNPLGPLSVINDTISRVLANQPTVPIAMLHYNYGAYKPNADANGLVRVAGNQIFDVAGQNPYDQRTLFAAAPAIDSSRSNRLSFIFKPNLFFNNTGKTVGSLQLDAGDGSGYVTVAWNTLRTVTYLAAGVKQIKVKINYTDGTSVESHSAVKITQAVPSMAGARYDFTTNPLEDLLQTFPANANHSGGFASVKYSTRNATGRLRRPLIILEGYDVSSAGGRIQQDYTFRDLVFTDPSPGSQTVGDLDIRWLRFGAISTDFLTALDEIGEYDLVFVNYGDGLDDIRRNAALLREVLVWVNGQKAAGGNTGPNVVMGISMGGLIARYELARMEKERRQNPTAQNDHQTRLLITHDSPHRGANTPLGLQTLTVHLGNIPVVGISGVPTTTTAADVYGELLESRRILAAQATKQLAQLTAEFPGNNNGRPVLATNTFLDGDYHSMITFPTNAPPPYRFVASSLGAECGTGNGIVPNDRLVSPTGGLTVPGINDPLALFGISVEGYANALPPTGGSNTISFLKVSNEIRLFGIRIRYTFYQRRVDYTNQSLFWDGAAGGTQTSNQVDPATGVWPGVPHPWIAFFVNPNVAPGRNRFCFVPVASALDVTNLTDASLSARYVGGVSYGNPSRADDFIVQTLAEGQNLLHPRFTPRNTEWMFYQMQALTPPDNPFRCSTQCPPLVLGAIGGDFDPAVCGNTTAQFSATPLGAGVSYQWATSSPNLVIESGQGTATVTVRRTAPCGGCTISVTATITGSTCPNRTTTATKTIANAGGGYGSGDYPVSGPDQATCGQLVAYSTVTLPGATNYQWVNIPAGATNVSGQGTPNLSFTVPSGITSMQVGVRVANACDAGGSPAIKPTSVTCGSGLRTASIHPNPASDELNVTLEPASKAAAATTSQPQAGDEQAAAWLVDAMGVKVWEGNLQEGKATFSVKHLPVGIYGLHIRTSQEVISRQVQIRR